MSRITTSLRALWSERRARRLHLRRVQSSARLRTEAHRLTDAIEGLLAARADVDLVSEEGWRSERQAGARELAMLVGSVANLSSGLVLRLQLLDGQSFELIDEVETVLGEDPARAADRLVEAVGSLLQPSARRECPVTRRRDS